MARLLTIALGIIGWVLVAAALCALALRRRRPAAVALAVAIALLAWFYVPRPLFPSGYEGHVFLVRVEGGPSFRPSAQLSAELVDRCRALSAQRSVLRTVRHQAGADFYLYFTSADRPQDTLACRGIERRGPSLFSSDGVTWVVRGDVEALATALEGSGPAGEAAP